MIYSIVNTGSDGNATVIENIIMIDCGLSYKKIKPYVNKLQLILLTHIHADHFNKATIRKLTFERPILRFGCCKWLVKDLIECGVSEKNIDVYDFENLYCYSSNLKVQPFELHHDVLQCGYRIEINGYKVFYATDTCTLEGIVAKDYDYYFVEANYINEEELHNRSVSEEYENRVKKTHMNKEKTVNWLLENMSDASKYEFMHQHKEKEVSKC